eukprot:COSAG02_NODE_13474_length_1390_cov_1.316034_1_plen_66_part_10
MQYIHRWCRVLFRGESLDAGNLGVRAFQIGAAAAENFWGNHTKAQGPGSPRGLGVSDRYNRFLCHR